MRQLRARRAVNDELRTVTPGQKNTVVGEGERVLSAAAHLDDPPQLLHGLGVTRQRYEYRRDGVQRAPLESTEMHAAQHEHGTIVQQYGCIQGQKSRSVFVFQVLIQRDQRNGTCVGVTAGDSHNFVAPARNPEVDHHRRGPYHAWSSGFV